LPDQYPGEKGSVVSPFFGQNAQTMTCRRSWLGVSDGAFLLIMSEIF
jgi:lauroyl/myristoyl acyltransferase